MDADAAEAIVDMLEAVVDVSETAPGCAIITILGIAIGVATWYFLF